MGDLIHALLGALRSGVRSRRELVLENLALRLQLAVFRRGTKRPRLRDSDRLFWIAMSRISSRWRGLIAVVQPETVVAWHSR